MASSGYALFETEMGSCGLAWSDGCVTATALPEASVDAIRTLLAVRAGATVESLPPPFARSAIDAIQAHLAGRTADLASIPISMERLPRFTRAVLEALRSVPSGATVTYADPSGRERRVSIVGADEVDADRGRVSWISPIARALLRAEVGDEVALRTPQGMETIEVLAIDYVENGD